MQQNPILMLMGQTEDMRRDYYRDLELKAETDKENVRICGVFVLRVLHPPRRRRRCDRGDGGGRIRDHRRRPRTLALVQVTTVPSGDLAGTLELLESSLRGGEPLPGAFAERLRDAVEAGDLEVLAARVEGRVIGVAVVAYRLNISAGGPFASIEDLYVRPETRRLGIARALLEAVAQRCKIRGASYIEAQVEDGEAAAFYSALGYEPEPCVRVFSRSYALEG